MTEYSFASKKSSTAASSDKSSSSSQYPHRDKASAAPFLLPGTCLASKSKSRIYASQRVIIAFGKSFGGWLRSQTRVCESVKTVKYLPNNQKRNFSSSSIIHGIPASTH